MERTALSTYTTEELREELKERKRLSDMAAAEMRQRHADSVYEHLDLFLLLTPEHYPWPLQEKCSDACLRVAGRQCSRCTMLHMKKEGYFDSDTLYFLFDVWIRDAPKDSCMIVCHHFDELLAVCSRHKFDTCSDADPMTFDDLYNTHTNVCARCAFLHGQRSGWPVHWEVDVSFVGIDDQKQYR